MSRLLALKRYLKRNTGPDVNNAQYSVFLWFYMYKKVHCESHTSVLSKAGKPEASHTMQNPAPMARAPYRGTIFATRPIRTFRATALARLLDSRLRAFRMRIIILKARRGRCAQLKFRSSAPELVAVARAGRPRNSAFCWTLPPAGEGQM